MMSRTGVICIFLAFLVEPEASSLVHSYGLVCVTDYFKTISCSLKLPVNSRRNPSYRLDIYSELDGHFYSQLQADREQHIASFTVKESFSSADHFSVTLHYSENGNNYSSLLNPSFIPAKNIKPKTPFNLTVQNANGMYNFFWKSGYEDHMYRGVLPLTYELLFYKDGVHDNVTVHNDKQMIENATNLDPHATYTAMVRTRIEMNGVYNGTWSDWSSPVSWTTSSAGEPDTVGRIFTVMFLILGLLIVLISIGAARFKIKENAWVPTPATYFQPLFQNHQGDFKGWVLEKCPLQDINVLEDFATIDKISEIITTLQDQTEKTVAFYAPAQGHPPYVGPTAELWAQCQMMEARSETSVSCEEFPLFCEELADKVQGLMQTVSVACLSEDVASLKDSALSLESLEDCEPREEPDIIFNPMPVCFKQDYCTLTDTPAGPVPTFSRDES